MTTVQGQFTYTVDRTVVVPPSDVAVIGPTSNPELTLTTCNPRFSAATRLVVHASLTAAAPATAPPSERPPARAVPTRPTSLDLAGSEGGWTAAASWGAGVVLVAATAWLVTRRLRAPGRRRHWPVAAAGTVVVLLVLFEFFGAVSPLLPASF